MFNFTLFSKRSGVSFRYQSQLDWRKSDELLYATNVTIFFLYFKYYMISAWHVCFSYKLFKQME